MLHSQKFLLTSTLGLSIFFVLPSLAESSNWPGFRGNGNSITKIQNLPLKWTEEEGILWKNKISGFGQSSPVIWNDRIYVTSTGGQKKEFLYLNCYDLNSGKSI